MYRRLADAIVQLRHWILPVLLGFGLLCAWQVPDLKFNFSPQQFFRTDSQLGEKREDFAETFGREDNLMAVTVSEGDVFQPEVLGALRNLTLELQDLESVKRAESIATFRIPRSGDSPGSLTVDPLLEQTLRTDEDGTDLPVDTDQTDALRDLAMNEPLVRGRLVSRSGESTALLVWLDDDIQRVTDLKHSLQSIRDRVDAHPLPDGYEYQFGGVPELRVEIIDSLRTEQYLFIPLTALIFLIVLMYLFRRPSGVVLPLAVVLLAVASTVALMVWMGAAINIVNNVLPTLIFIIGIADSIHMLTRQAEEIEDGASPLEAIKAMIEHTGFACLMTSTTTAVGFVSLLTANTRILQNFAWQAAAGVMFAYLFTLLLLPSALSYMKPVQRRASRRADSIEEAPLLERWVMKGGRWILDRPLRVIGGGLIVCACAGYFASKVVVNTTLLEVFHRDHPSYQTTQMLEEKFGGFLPLEVSLQSDEKGRFKDPEVYRKIRKLQERASQYEPVLSTQSLVDFHQSARAALLNDPEEREVMPDGRGQIEQLHLLIAGSPDAPSGPNQYITQDFSHARVLLRVRDVGAKRQLKLAKQVRGDLNDIFRDTSDISWDITGDAYVASAALNSFIYDLFYSLLFAGIIIFLLMTFMFRSVQLGLISMIPNAIPLLITFGYMGLEGINLNSTTVIIFAIGLGLAVDDTIHVLARFREERERADSIREAIMETYFGAGRAIVLTSVLLIAGMSLLMWSNFIPTRQFGTLITITVLAAIFGDLMLLPPFLYLLFRDGEHADEESR